MVRFNGTALLVGKTYVSDSVGNRRPSATTPRKVFVNKFTISAASYNAAALLGLTPSCELELRSQEYLGEEELIYGNEKMKVISSKEKGDFTRIVCVKEASNE